MTTQFSNKRKRTTSDQKAASPASTKSTKKNITKAKKDVSRRTKEATGQAKDKDEENGTTVAVGGDNPQSLAELGLPQRLVNSLSAVGIAKLSELQSEVVPQLLNGHDVTVVSSNPSVVFAFLIPAVARLEKHRSRPRHGTVVAVVTTSRESAIQIAGQATELLSGTSHTVGLLVDEANRGAEVEKLERGINLLIGTPARMADHFLNTTGLVIKNLQALFVDKADQIVNLGYERYLKDILSQIPKEGRQTGIFGKTRADGLTSLTELICRAEVLHSHDDDGADMTANNESTSKQKQGYVLVEADRRFLLLHAFLKKFQQKRILVIMASTAEVMFYAELLNNSLLEETVHEIHGKQNSKKRAAVVADFSTTSSNHSVLLSTEEALEGIKIPPVDWTLHYDPPQSVTRLQEPISRGYSVLFLLPEERKFVEELKAASREVEEFDFPKKKLSNIQPQVEKLVAKNYELNSLAKDGFRSYLQGYHLQPNSQIFDATKLDVAKVAKSFGFSTPPRVSLQEEAPKPKDTRSRPYGPTNPDAPRKKKRVA